MILNGSMPNLARLRDELRQAGAVTISVVGPPRSVAGVEWVAEPEPYGGPVAALAQVEFTHQGHFLLCAGDAIGATADTFARLVAAAHGHDGAYAQGPDGYPQWLLACYRTTLVTAAAGSMKAMLAGRDLVPVAATEAEVRDVDTPADLARLLHDGYTLPAVG
jgi:molybdopterin-guanine dinucleotide biosynthesis protein A